MSSNYPLYREIEKVANLEQTANEIWDKISQPDYQEKVREEMQNRGVSLTLRSSIDDIEVVESSMVGLCYD